SCGERMLIACQLRFSTSTIALVKMLFIKSYFCSCVRQSAAFFLPSHVAGISAAFLRTQLRGVCSLLKENDEPLAGLFHQLTPALSRRHHKMAGASGRKNSGLTKSERAGRSIYFAFRGSKWFAGYKL